MPYKDKEKAREAQRRSYHKRKAEDPEFMERHRAKGRASFHGNRESNIARVKQWRKDNPEKRKAARRKWYLANREQIKAAHQAKRLSGQLASERMMRRYGIAPEQRLVMEQAQNNQCAICGCPGDQGTFQKLVIDHCHRTGEVRSLLCADCNSGLGFFKDRTDLMVAAARYIEFHALKASKTA